MADKPSGEKVDVTVEPATEASLSDFFQGEAHMQGGRHDLDSRGWGSGMPGNEPAEEAAEEPTEREYVQDSEEEWPTEPNFQQLYGRSENEKGEWRRTAQEAMQELERAKQELAAMRAGFQPGNPYTPQTPGYAPSNPYVPQAQQYSPQMPQPELPRTFFEGKEAGDYISVEEIDAVLRTRFAPAVLELHQQQLQLQYAQLQAQKASMGITPQVEQQIMAKYPWIGGMPEGPQRIQAIASMMNHERVTQQRPPSPARNAPQPKASPTQAAARRVTYVETGTGRAVANPQKSVQEQVKEEFYAAQTATDKRKVLEKYGLRTFNDFGPEFLTR